MTGLHLRLEYAIVLADHLDSCMLPAGKGRGSSLRKTFRYVYEFMIVVKVVCDTLYGTTGSIKTTDKISQVSRWDAYYVTLNAGCLG